MRPPASRTPVATNPDASLATDLMADWTTAQAQALLAVPQAAFAEQARAMAQFTQSRIAEQIAEQMRPVVSALAHQAVPRFNTSWSGVNETLRGVLEAHAQTQELLSGLFDVEVTRFLPVLDMSRWLADGVWQWPRHTELIAELERSVRLAGIVPAQHSRPALSTYRALLTFVQETPHSPLPTAGFGVTGLVASDVVLGSSPSEHALSEQPVPGQGPSRQSASHVIAVEEELVDGWQRARESTYRDLYDVLGKLDASVPDLLQGAWMEVHRDGPARISKLANCVVEALDRALRAGAPDHEVQAWALGTDQPVKNLQANGRWTRAARIRYLLRYSGYSPKLAEQQAIALCASQAEVNQRLQAAKHASVGDVEATKVHLVTAEAILSQLFSAAAGNKR